MDFSTCNDEYYNENDGSVAHVYIERRSFVAIIVHTIHTIFQNYLLMGI